MKKVVEYKIKGNHPILKRIDHIAIGVSAMHREIDELLGVGYEVTIEKQWGEPPEQSEPSEEE